MKDHTGIFEKKRADPAKLLAFGFERNCDAYRYSTPLQDSGFVLTVTVTGDEISVWVTDPESGEPYTLHLSEEAEGAFVGGVRKEYERVLTEIERNCFESDRFKSSQAKELIAYIRKTYGDTPEFLWEKFPDNAVFRRKDNQKWYGALLTVAKEKLGIPESGKAEIIDLRIPPEQMESTVDGKRFFPGYHMNKKHWYTVTLDGSVCTEELCGRIDQSYRIAGKKK